jgi:hypothetical protein
LGTTSGPRIEEFYLGEPDLEAYRLSRSNSLTERRKSRDAFWIDYDSEIHPHAVIAVLRHLEARGELPETQVNS